MPFVYDRHVLGVSTSCLPMTPIHLKKKVRLVSWLRAQLLVNLEKLGALTDWVRQAGYGDWRISK